MASRPTWAADLNFSPKVWSDHARAYFDKKLVLGSIAYRNEDLKNTGTGKTVNFPYYNTIGQAEEPQPHEKISTDNLADDSFSATVFEVAKSVSFTENSFLSSADGPEGMTAEANRQIGRVLAEKVEERLAKEVFTYDGTPTLTPGVTAADYDNMTIGFTASAKDVPMTASRLLEGYTLAFGDKKDDISVCFMHSVVYLDMMQDSSSGFLKADANSPFNALKGYVGVIHGVPVVINDSICPKLSAQIGGQDAYLSHFHKPNAYGIIDKKDINMVEDYDALSRQMIIAANQWYGVKSFHAKIDSQDQKSGGLITTTTKKLNR